jgi:quercetin dioxygenase-like cupin family protein
MPPTLDLATPRLFRWDQTPVEQVTQQLTRQVITGERVMVAHIRLEKGCVVPQHAHEAEQLSFTFSGSLKFVINGETIVVGPGQLLVIPSWVKHEAVALEDTYEMDVFSPIRVDWLERTDSYFSNPPTQAADFSNPASAANPARLVTWSEVPVERLSGLIDRAYVSGERTTFCDFLLREGAVVPAHQHDNEQITWVRSGHLRLTVGGQTFEVTEGSVLRIPSQISHSAEAVAESRVIDLFSPRREDWIAKDDQYLRQGSR